MRALISLLLVAGIAFSSKPAFARSQSCPEGTEVSGTEIESVQDIFQVRAQYRRAQVNFNNVELAEADFSGQDVSNLCFENAKLPNSNWSSATGNNAQFHDSDLVGSRWDSFSGENLVFSGSNLSDASLVNSTMRASRFIRVRMERLNASGTDLSGGLLEGHALSSLKSARFDNANMTGFEFRCGIGQSDNCGQYSSEVSLIGANLTNASILMAFKSEWDFNDAVINNTRMHFFQLDWVRESRIEGVIIVEPTAWTPARDSHSELLRPVTLSHDELQTVWRAFDRLDEPGFECSKARSPAEHYICDRRPYHNRSVFSEADRELNQAYILAWRKDHSIVADQRRWLQRRDACMAVEGGDYGWPRDNCIATAYRDRIEELWQIAGMEAELDVGDRQFFVDQQTGEFLWQIEDRSLRTKLTPVALGNSWELVVVGREPQGLLWAKGSVTGANYHMGALWSPDSGLVFDPLSGFYGGSEPCLPEYQICPVVRFRGYYLDTAPESISDRDAGEYHFNNFISSGARAGFGRLVAIPNRES